MRRILLVYTLILASVVLAIPARAVPLDQAAGALQRGKRVYDFAGVLSPSDSARLHADLAKMEKKGLAEGAVVVLDRLEGAPIQDYALRLGERWKIGRKDVDNGFVLVVSMQDRKWRLEVGRDLQSVLPDAKVSRIGRDLLVPALRQGRYADGLDAAVTEIDRQLEAAGGAEALPTHDTGRSAPAGLVWLTLLLGAGAAVFALRSWPRGALPDTDSTRLPMLVLGFGSLGAAVYGAGQAAGYPYGLLALGVPAGAFAAIRMLESSWVPVPLEAAGEMGRRFGTFYWIAVAAVVVTAPVTGVGWWAIPFLLLAAPIGIAVGGYFRRVPRKCPECGGALRWLPEAEEAPFLREEENAEQQAGGVDYDVWRCSKCSRSAIFAHTQLFSRVAQCPVCRRRTLTTRTVVSQEPSEWSDGWVSDVTECQNPRCRHRDEKKRQVPGYRGGGFGGGNVIILPPVFGGGGGGDSSWGGDSGGGGFDVGDFGGGGGFDGGGAGGDW